MANYLLAYHGGGMPETPEQQAAVMQAWMTWMGALGSAVIDGGNPVGATKVVGSTGAVTDGGGANPVTGYSILQADSLEAAVKLAQGCPVLAAGGSVEVCETFNAM